MSSCIYTGPGPCVWCRLPSDEHDLYWCPRCSGMLSTPDPMDRVSRRLNRPTWQWDQIDCECTRDEHGFRRRGGVVDGKGVPVEDEDLRRRGLR